MGKSPMTTLAGDDDRSRVLFDGVRTMEMNGLSARRDSALELGWRVWMLGVYE